MSLDYGFAFCEIEPMIPFLRNAFHLVKSRKYGRHKTGFSCPVMTVASCLAIVVDLQTCQPVAIHFQGAYKLKNYSMPIEFVVGALIEKNLAENDAVL